MSELDELIKVIKELPASRRKIIAVAGAPASGKSTIAEAICDKMNDIKPDCANILPMDGFHYDDTLLKARGIHSLKGAPHTFDVLGFAHMLKRLVARDEDEVVTPVFDRSIEIARAGANPISKDVEYIIVEGNYVLVEQTPWSELKPYFDLSVFVSFPVPILEQRLRQRWIDHGLDEAGIKRKLEEVDLPNGEYIRANSIRPDITFQMEV
ncbi:MAG: nucleoside/nucleotide kinase family protein [Lentilitoribacter sp.]